MPVLGRDLARVGGRWAELEEFVPHVQPNPSQESYLRLFEELGRLHAGLRAATRVLSDEQPRPSP